MINKFKKIAALVFSIAAAVFSTPSFAYNDVDFTVTDDNMFCVDEFHGLNNHVTMYLIQPSDIEHISNIFNYEFECTSGKFEYSEGGGTFDCGELLVKCRPENKELVETVDGFEITRWRFGVEDGIYCFARPDGFNGVYTLPSSFESPWDSAWFTTSELVEISDGTDMRIYVMNGPEEWAKEKFPEFRDWAINVESNYVAKIKQLSGESSTISVEGSEEIAADESLVAEEVPEMEEEPVVEEAPQMVESTATEGPSIMDYVKPVAGVAIFVVVALVVRKITNPD